MICNILEQQKRPRAVLKAENAAKSCEQEAGPSLWIICKNNTTHCPATVQGCPQPKTLQRQKSEKQNFTKVTELINNLLLSIF